jgi:hypothetical protein
MRSRHWRHALARSGVLAQNRYLYFSTVRITGQEGFDLRFRTGLMDWLTVDKCCLALRASRAAWSQTFRSPFRYRDGSFQGVYGLLEGVAGHFSRPLAGVPLQVPLASHTGNDPTPPKAGTRTEWFCEALAERASPGSWHRSEIRSHPTWGSPEPGQITLARETSSRMIVLSSDSTECKSDCGRLWNARRPGTWKWAGRRSPTR